MKLRVFSELRCEHYDGYYNARYKCDNPSLNSLFEKIEEIVETPEQDEILVLAGGVGEVFDYYGNIHSNYVQTLKFLRSKWKRIVYVPGIHEYYNCKNIEQCDSAMKNICDELKITFLQKAITEIDGYTFVGATMWSPINLEAWQKMHYKARNLFGSNYRSRKMYLDHKDWLTNKLSEMKDNPPIVVTSHLPLFEINHLRYSEDKYRDLVSVYCSDSSDMILKLSNSSSVERIWICGYSNESSKLVKYGLKFYLNPIGEWFDKRRSQIDAQCISL